MSFFSRSFLNHYLVLFAVLCLQVVQQGAVWHALSHHVPRSEIREDYEKEKPGRESSAHFCEKCLLYAEAGAGIIPDVAKNFAVDDTQSSVVLSFQPYFPRTTTAAYAARAPPPLS